MNVPELQKMGADITKVDDKHIIIKGKTSLKGFEVTATDLRAGACLVLAGLAADGETIVNDVEHLLRGYENIIEKLEGVGAKISLEEI